MGWNLKRKVTIETYIEIVRMLQDEMPNYAIAYAIGFSAVTTRVHINNMISVGLLECTRKDSSHNKYYRATKDWTDDEVDEMTFHFFTSAVDDPEEEKEIDINELKRISSIFNLSKQFSIDKEKQREAENKVKRVLHAELFPVTPLQERKTRKVHIGSTFNMV